MAIKPKEIIDFRMEAEIWEGNIDDFLKKHWRGTGPVNVDLPEVFPELIVNKLKAIYEKAGWDVVHHSGNSQKDGSWNYLSFNAKLVE